MTPKPKTYEPVDGYSRELKQAADIAQRHRVATLVEIAARRPWIRGRPSHET
jgi:hypothetical protein